MVGLGVVVARAVEPAVVRGVAVATCLVALADGVAVGVAVGVSDAVGVGVATVTTGAAVAAASAWSVVAGCSWQPRRARTQISTAARSTQEG
jgi:hypothetical protein